MTGCASTQKLHLAALAIECGPNIPEEYRKRIVGIAPLAKGSDVGDLGSALDTQTAKLTQEGSQKLDVISIVDKCDARNKKVMEILTPKKKRFFFF